jgi:hypothetical protein
MKLNIKIIYILWLNLFCNYALAQNKLLTCTNNETNFITNFKIEFIEKKITHLSSLNTKNNQRFNVNTEFKIISFDENTAIAYTYSNNVKLINFVVFNFKDQYYTISGHYLDIRAKPNPQLFECVLN